MANIDGLGWYEVFAKYNQDWLPVLLVLWAALVICTSVLFIRATDKTNALPKACLAVIFAWISIVFFFRYMRSSAVPGGIPMLAISILFAVDIWRNKIRISLPQAGWKKYVTLSLVIWALGVYTVAGWLSGHPYPAGPMLTAPCPITIFAITLLSTSMKTLRTDRIPFTLIFVFLLWWSFFSGLGAPFSFGFYLDFTLFATGLYGLTMLVTHWSHQTQRIT